LRPIQKCRSCHLLAGLPEIRFGSAASPRAASPVHRGRWQEITDGKKNINNVHITYNLSCTETCTGRFDLIYVSYVLHTILFCLLHRAKRRGSGGATTTDSDRGCTAPVWPRRTPSGRRSTGGCKPREHDYETKPNLSGCPRGYRDVDVRSQERRVFPPGRAVCRCRGSCSVA
jgi:hypothetical protein